MVGYAFGTLRPRKVTDTAQLSKQRIKCCYRRRMWKMSKWSNVYAVKYNVSDTLFKGSMTSYTIHVTLIWYICFGTTLTEWIFSHQGRRWPVMHNMLATPSARVVFVTWVQSVKFSSGFSRIYIPRILLKKQKIKPHSQTHELTLEFTHSQTLSITQSLTNSRDYLPE